jgi:hypothetical protein
MNVTADPSVVNRAFFENWGVMHDYELDRPLVGPLAVRGDVMSGKTLFTATIPRKREILWDSVDSDAQFISTTTAEPEITVLLIAVLSGLHWSGKSAYSVTNQMGQYTSSIMLSGLLPRSIRTWATNTSGASLVEATPVSEGSLTFPLSVVVDILSKTRASDLIAQMMKYVTRLRLYTAFYEAVYILSTNMHVTPTTVSGAGHVYREGIITLPEPRTIRAADDAFTTLKPYGISSDAKQFVAAFVANPGKTLMRCILWTENWWIVESNYERATVQELTGAPARELNVGIDECGLGHSKKCDKVLGFHVGYPRDGRIGTWIEDFHSCSTNALRLVKGSGVTGEGELAAIMADNKAWDEDEIPESRCPALLAPELMPAMRDGLSQFGAPSSD